MSARSGHHRGLHAAARTAHFPARGTARVFRQLSWAGRGREGPFARPACGASRRSLPCACRRDAGVGRHVGRLRRTALRPRPSVAPSQALDWRATRSPSQAHRKPRAAGVAARALLLLAAAELVAVVGWTGRSPPESGRRLVPGTGAPLGSGADRPLSSLGVRPGRHSGRPDRSGPISFSAAWFPFCSMASSRSSGWIEPAALLAAFVVAAHPLLIAFSGVLGRQPAYMFAACGSTLALIGFLRSGRWGPFIGFLLGAILATTSRPEGAQVVILYVAVLLAACDWKLARPASRFARTRHTDPRGAAAPSRSPAALPGQRVAGRKLQRARAGPSDPARLRVRRSRPGVEAPRSRECVHRSDSAAVDHSVRPRFHTVRLDRRLDGGARARHSTARRLGGVVGPARAGHPLEMDRRLSHVRRSRAAGGQLAVRIDSPDSVCDRNGAPGSGPPRDAHLAEGRPRRRLRRVHGRDVAGTIRDAARALHGRPRVSFPRALRLDAATARTSLRLRLTD